MADYGRDQFGLPLSAGGVTVPVIVLPPLNYTNHPVNFPVQRNVTPAQQQNLSRQQSTGTGAFKTVTNTVGFLANATKVGQTAVDKAKKLLNIASAATPIGASLAVAKGATGLVTGEGWLSQFKKWLMESGFFQRFAMVLIGLLFLGAAFALLAKGQVTSQVVKAIK